MHVINYAHLKQSLADQMGVNIYEGNKRKREDGVQG